MPVRFISGGHRMTRRKPPTCHKSMTKFDHLMFYRVPLIKSLNSKKDIKYNGQKRRKHKRRAWPTKHRKHQATWATLDPLHTQFELMWSARIRSASSNHDCTFNTQSSYHDCTFSKQSSSHDCTFSTQSHNHDCTFNTRTVVTMFIWYFNFHSFQNMMK